MDGYQYIGHLVDCIKETPVRGRDIDLRRLLGDMAEATHKERGHDGHHISCNKYPCVEAVALVEVSE